MFAARYYTGRHFARRYFPSGTASILHPPKVEHTLYGPRSYTILYGDQVEDKLVFSASSTYRPLNG